MKKKNIIFLILLFALIFVTSCDDENQTQIIKDRGIEDFNDYNIKLPDALFDAGSDENPIDIPDNPIDSNVDISGSEALDFNDGNHFESNAGEGNLLEIENDKILTATPNIGYDFLGWFIFDKLYSLDEVIKISKEENVIARFEIKEEFKDLIFESTPNSCILKGVKATCPSNLILPEGITKICENAFNDSNVILLNIPSSVTEIEKYSFANSNILGITFNSIPLNLGYFLDFNSYIFKINVLCDADLESFSKHFINYENSFDSKENNIFIKDDYVFYFDLGNYTLIKYLGDEKNLELPNELDEIKEYIIGEGAFVNSNIESIVIPDSVYKIDDYAFYNCKNLSKITLGKNLSYIGYNSFYYCENLKIIINNSSLNIYVGSYDYGYIAYYASMVIEDDEINILNSSNFNYIEQDDNIYLISYSGNDKNITIPKFDNKKIILGEKLFYLNKNIENVILNENVISIEDYAFYNCENLFKIEMPNVEYIGKKSFMNCYNLREVSFPNIKNIDDSAFSYCYTLYQLTLPETLISIGDSSFYYNRNLVEIINKSDLSISKGLYSYGYIAYYALSVIEDKSDSILTNNNGLIIADNDGVKELVAIIDYDLNIVDVPDYIDVIYNNVFSGLNIIELYMPILDNELRYYFNNNVSKTLKKITLGEGVDVIPYFAFSDINSLEEIGFTKNVYLIDYCAFYGTNIKKVYYDGSIEDWCKIDFAYLESNPLYSGNATILFKGDDGYNKLDVIEIPDTINSINNYQFYGFAAKELILNDEITYIGESAFAKTGLEKIKLPNENVYVARYAFSNNKYLKSIVIPSEWNEISEGLFEGCSNLLSVILSENINIIGDYAFKKCRSLSIINFPDSLTQIGISAFEACENIENIDLSNTNIIELDDDTFKNCKNLSTIQFSSMIENISSTTFEGCDKLNLTSYKNGLYFGTNDNPYRWLVTARAKSIFEISVHPDCEKIFKNAFSKCSKLKKVIIPEGCNDFSGILSGLENIQYIEFPYNDGLDTFGYSLFSTSNTYIPSKITNIVINGGTTIPDNAFNGIEDLKYIELADSITTIGKNAFQSTNIESFIKSNTSSLSKIGDKAFYNCKSLTEVNLAYFNATNYSLGESLFEGCSKLNDVTLPSNIGYTSKRMFYGCKALTSITLPNSLATINDYSFAQSGLTSINFNNVTGINSYAFSGSALTSVTLGDKITSMGYSSNIFANCLNLETVSLRYNVSSNMFNGCINLKTVTLNNQITSIGSYAFKNCTSLESINLPSGVTISNYAFSNSGLKSIAIPANAILRSNAFDGCIDLETVTMDSSASFYTSDIGFFANCSKLRNINLPSTITSIPRETFKNCTSLDNECIDFTYITSIGQSAFENTGFTNLDLGDILISDSSFKGCIKLVSIKINSSITNAQSAFANCILLSSVKLSENVGNRIPKTMFSGCTSLKYEELELPSCINYIYSNAFSNTGSEDIVIASNLEIYDEAFSNNKNLLKVEINGKLSDTSLSYYSCASGIFRGCSNLKEVIIGGNNKTVGVSLFDGCISLSKITLPDDLTKIETYAFYNCKSLESIVLPSSLNSIGFNAFEGCYQLVEVYNLSSLDLILGSTANGYVAYYAKKIHTSLEEESIIIKSGDYVFTFVDDIAYIVGYLGDDKELTLPDNFIYKGNVINEYKITQYMFINKDIVSISIPDSVTSIGDLAFYNCTSLRSIHLSNNLKTIGDLAFYNCISLTNIILPSSLESIGDLAFNCCYKLFEIYNLSNLEIDAGSTNNGYVAYFAKVIHESIDEESILKFDDNGFVFANYKTDSYDGVIIGYFGNETDLIIPGSFEWNGIKITNLYIIEYAFANMNFTSLILKDGISILGNYSFTNCTIGYLELADSIIECENQPFIYSNITKVKCNAFLCQFISNNNWTNYNLKEVIIAPSDFSSISYRNFSNCTSLEKILIPVNILSIEMYAFYGCSSLKDIYYCGTKEEFKNIYIYYYNSSFEDATKYYYSETEPESIGNYWHFVDDEIVIW